MIKSMSILNSYKEFNVNINEITLINSVSVYILPTLLIPIERLRLKGKEHILNANSMQTITRIPKVNKKKYYKTKINKLISENIKKYSIENINIEIIFH